MTDRIDTAKEREKLVALEGHTPGPWRSALLDSDLNREAALRRGIIKEGEYFGYAVCPEPWEGLSVALMPACDADHSKDAELVAAAPDLKATLAAALDEIERLREALESCPPTSNPSVTAEYHLERINAWWKNIARAALNREDEA